MSSLKHRMVSALAVLAISLASCSSANAQTWRVTVRGGDTDHAEIPIVSTLTDDVPIGIYVLEPTEDPPRLLAQVFEESGKRFIAFILPRGRAQRSTKYVVKAVSNDNSEHAAGISIRERGPNLTVALDQKLLTDYRVDAGNKPFYFPLIGPSGDPTTRAYPMETVPGEDDDHPHQRSCWFTHGSVNGVDFWAEGKNSGTIRETARTVVTQGPVLGRLATTNDWCGPGGSRVCQDQRVTTFYATHDARLIDFEIKVVATDGPVTFGDTKEGMFGLRVASSMDAAKKFGGKITNADGLTNASAWGQASPWVDYVGPVNGKTVGIAILNHPESFRYPTTWHVRPYGLFAANPFGWHDFGQAKKGDHTVPAGQSITFRYRVILHEGDTGSAALAERFLSYGKPASVEILKD
jgi:hypothetical protein